MDVKKRIKRLQQLLIEHRCDAILVENPIDLLYLTGMELSTGQLLVSTKSARLIVDGRYYEVCKTRCPLPTVLFKKEALGMLLQAKPFEEVVKLAFDGEATSYGRVLEYRSLVRAVHTQSSKKRNLKLVPLTHPIKELRAIKDADEILVLKKVAQLGSKGYDFICTQLKPGITELEAAAELEIFWKRHGSQGLAFESIIAFGTHGSMPHYRPGKVKLKKGDPILIDIGVKWGHYHSDMTRTVFFGKPSGVMEEIYRIVLKAQTEALKLCKPGIAIADLDGCARGIITAAGYGKNFNHSLGHGIGLEVHELPFLRGSATEVLRPGMAITIEPGIYLPGIGGVRIEDTVIITEDGYENLTKRPKTLQVLH